MLAYKIAINETHALTAGQEDWAVLTTAITALHAQPDLPEGSPGIGISISGVAENTVSQPPSDDVHECFFWKNVELNIGDIVTIEIVDVLETDEPTIRKLYDRRPRDND